MSGKLHKTIDRMDKRFWSGHEPRHSGVVFSRSRIYTKCDASDCGTEGFVNAALSTPPEQVRRMFRNAGWSVSGKHMFCPLCTLLAHPRKSNRYDWRSGASPIPYTAALVGETVAQSLDDRNELVKATAHADGSMAVENSVPCKPEPMESDMQIATTTRATTSTAKPETDKPAEDEQHHRYSIKRKMMRPAEERVLYSLLDDAWDNDTGRYKPGWSDARVAKAVGCSISSVAHRRSAAYGAITEGTKSAVLERIETLEGLYLDLLARIERIEKR